MIANDSHRGGPTAAADLARLRTTMPAELQVEVAQATDRWSAGLLTRSWEAARTLIEEGFAAVLRARHCALLLMREMAPGPEEPAPALEWGGRVWGQELYRAGDAFPQEILPEAGASPEEELWPGDWGRSLRLPVGDRKGNWLALVLIADAAHPQAVPAAQLLAAESANLLDGLRTQMLIHDLLTRTRQASSFDEARELLVVVASRLVRANRAEIAYWHWTDGDKGRFFCHVVVGDPEEVGRKEPLQGGLVAQVWEDDSPVARLEPDVRRPGLRGIYRECHPRTESELLIRINQSLGSERQTRRIGVLNLESFSRGGEGGFDEQDKQALELLVDTVVEESLLVRRQRSLQGVIETLAGSRGDFGRAAEQLLEAVRDSYGFDCGIIYRPDYRQCRLIAFKSLGTKPIDPDLLEFSYGFQEKAAATHAFNKREAYYSLEPWNDSEVVNLRGVREFGIESPLYAFPLVVEVEVPGADPPPTPVVVGVLVLWTDKNPPLIKDDKELLEPFTKMAALVLHAVLREDRRERFQRALNRIHQRMQATSNLRANLSEIMEAAQDLDFDRVRVFRFDYGDQMTPFDCRGMDEYETGFLDCVQRMEDHPYAHDLITHIHTDNTDNASRYLARCYPRPELGPDRDAAKLGRPPHLPWIDVPLVSAGKLYGELALDNARSGRPFDETDLEYANILGALAARAFAIEEKRGLIRPEALATLFGALDPHCPEPQIRRCLLRFLTHGNGGLGFSRAVFLAWDGDTRRYLFTDAVGSRDEETFTRVAKVVREMSLEEVLGRASEPCDPDLYGALAGTVVRESDVEAGPCQVLKADRSDPATPLWLRDLCRKLHADCVLVARVEHDRKPLGLLLIDRAFQDGRSLSEADEHVLTSFSRQAGQLLLLHRLYRDRLELQRTAQLGMVTSGLTHELRQPLAALRNELALLARMLPPRGEVAVQLSLLVKQAERLGEILSRLGELFTKDEWKPTLLGEVIGSLVEEWQATTREVVIHAQIPSNLPPVPLFAGLFRLALNNLIRNAVQALDKVDPPREVTVLVRWLGGRVEVEVRDNGPGLPPAVRAAFDRGENLGMTTRPGRGLGIGLSLVRFVALKHDGKFRYDDGPGTRAVLTLPLY